MKPKNTSDQPSNLDSDEEISTKYLKDFVLIYLKILKFVIMKKSLLKSKKYFIPNLKFIDIF